MKRKFKVFFALTVAVLTAISFCNIAVNATVKSGQKVVVTDAQNQVGKMKISWDEVSGANSYEVQKKQEGRDWSDLCSTKETSISDDDVKNGKIYSYRVRAVTKKGKTEYAQISNMYLGSPVIKSVSNNAKGLLIKWKRCTVATGYKVYRKAEGDKEYSLIAEIQKNSPKYTDEKVEAYKKYSYKVKQVCGEYISASKMNGKSALYIPQVKNLTVFNSPKGVKLKWSKVEGAKGYSVLRKNSQSGKWEKIGVSKSDSKCYYYDKTTVYGKKNSYRVRAYISSKQYGAYSNTFSLYSVNPKKPMVALTYDDGPYTPATNRILDALQKNGGRATFFVVGSRITSYSDCIKREARLGCEIANHTYSHTSLTKLSSSTIREEISKTDELVKKYTGKTVNLVRAPGGSVNQVVRDNVKHPLVNWSVDTLDWSHRTASKTVENIKKGVKDGSIVLMHDLYVPTAEASEKVIPWLVKEGYQLVTVSEMMDAKGISLKNGCLYRNA